MKVMIVVTHLLGTGHLSRALTLARAFQAAGHGVHVVSGGRPAPHLDPGAIPVTQLAPVASDGVHFTRLLDHAGQPVSPAVMQDRLAQLLELLTTFAPDVLITELFPFGRRILRDEFGAVLAAAAAMSPKPMVLSSVRDILAPPSKPSKAEFVQRVVAGSYDGVLVHADPSVITLDQSWPVTPDIAAKLHYTGFVAPPPLPPAHQHTQEVIVSAGGGDVGRLVFEAALGAARARPALQWTMFAGGDAERRAAWTRVAGPNVAIHAPSAVFRDRLNAAAASVSMSGYNTALDLLQTGVPAVIVPFDDGGEVEQALRAEALSKLDGIAVLRQSDLNADTLSTAVDSVLNAPRRLARQAGMNGADRTVEIVELLQEDRL